MRAGRFGMTVAAMTVAINGAAWASDTSLRPQQRPASIAEIRKAEQGFERWTRVFQSRAARQGISDKTFADAFRGVRYDPEIIKRDKNQSEFNKTIWQYLDSAASNSRIANGKSALRQYLPVLRKIEQRYGVEKEIVVAVWGLESGYGVFRGTNDVIESMATLAYEGRRGAFFEQQREIQH